MEGQLLSLMMNGELLKNKTTSMQRKFQLITPQDNHSQALKTE
jgi:hypothetical protein